MAPIESDPGTYSLPEPHLAEQWARVREALRREIGDAAFRSWVAPVTLVAHGRGAVLLAAPTRFLRNWVVTHYSDRLRALWRKENDAVQGLDMVVSGEFRPPEASPDTAQARAEAQAVPPLPVGATDGAGVPMPSENGETKGGVPVAVAGQDDETAAGGADAGLSAPLDARFTFENFVIGRPNEFAYAAAKRVAESSTVSFNPLFLYGGVGLGKTHLMHAIAWHIRKRNPERNVVYLSAEKFMYQFIRALRYKDTVNFKEQFRSVDVLMIDDVQFIGGKDSTQEEFFHTFNALIDRNRQIVISADKSPSDLQGVEERLRSRLSWGLVADLHATTYELRLSILQAKVEQLGAKVPTAVLEFLAQRIASNIRELEGALNRVVAHATLVGRDITLDSTQEILHDLLRASDRRITIEEIQRRVAEHFNIRVSEMHSARRSRAVARPRQVAMYLAKHLTARSLPEIGRKFGGRDHTTVMHAVRKVEELRTQDPTFAEDVELLRRTLER
ncbi:MAG: chromosomal replication initiator protein DnaA [Alphaproteobacteria bacterium]